MSTCSSKETLSVIVPFYKIEKYADECIISIENQNAAGLTVILIDDGSPDSCGLICDGNALTDSRIITIHKKNAGLSDARNSGLRIVNTQYITFVDGDDYLLSQYAYKNVLKAIITTQTDMAYFGYVTFRDGEEPVRPENMHNGIVKVMNRAESLEFFLDKSLTMYGAVQWNKIFRSSLFEGGVHYDSGAYCQDLRIMPDIEKKICSTVMVDECAVAYRIEREQSITNVVKPKLIFDRTLSVAKTLEFARTFGNEAHIKMLADSLASYCMSSYYMAWRGSTNESEEYRKEIMQKIDELLHRHKKILLSGKYVDSVSKRVGLRLFIMSRYLFLVYNRIFKVFSL